MGMPAIRCLALRCSDLRSDCRSKNPRQTAEWKLRNGGCLDLACDRKRILDGDACDSLSRVEIFRKDAGRTDLQSGCDDESVPKSHQWRRWRHHPQGAGGPSSRPVAIVPVLVPGPTL